jgi:phosphoglycolate phosphatase-like HAD superfamily hydrolase
MQKSPIDLVVFDIAGTTIKDNNNVHLSLMNALLEFGYTSSLEEANAVMGYPKPFAIEQLLNWHAIS